MVDGYVEKPLQLVRVQVESQNPIGSSLFDHVCDQLGADRHPRLVLAILSCITEVRQHGRDTGRRGSARCINQQQHLKHVFGGRIGGLHDKDIGAANVFVDANKYLTIGEARAGDFARLGAEMARDFVDQRLIGRA